MPESWNLIIREERIKQGISQKELGEMIGLPQQAINRIEQGQRKIDIELFEKLCTALKFDKNMISNYFSADPPSEISEEHPIAFPGLEKKMSEIGYSIRYGCDYIETSNDEIWINYPDGEQIYITLQELEALNTGTDTYLKFLLEELRKTRGTTKKTMSNINTTA